MSWVYRFDSRALKELRKLGYPAQKLIVDYLDIRISGDEDPRRFGKALKAGLVGLWRYRIEDYRLICQIQDQELTVLIVTVGHRSQIYR